MPVSWIYIQSTITLHRRVNLNLSNKYLLSILISVMAECFNKICFKFSEYLNVSVKCAFNFYLFTQLLANISVQGGVSIRPIS